MMAEITDAHGSVCSEALLPFEIPFLILRRVGESPGIVEFRREELRDSSPDLGEGFTGREPIQECRIRVGSILKETGDLVGRKVVVNRGE